MADILARLYQDHMHFSKLLALLERQIRLLDQGEEPDYDLMLVVMRYMMNYPDMTHHPIEHLIFEKAVEHDETLYLLVKKLFQEHEQLHQYGVEFTHILQNIVESQMITPREKLKAYGMDYVNLLRWHMEKEGHGIFIVANELLDKHDWEEVRQEFLSRRCDPLFGGNVEEAYNILYRYIINA